MVFPGLNGGIRISRGGMWESSLNHREAGRVKAPSHVGRLDPGERSPRKEATEDFICVFPHVSLSLPLQAFSKGHQPTSHPEFPLFSLLPCAHPHLRHPCYGLNQCKSLPIYCPHSSRVSSRHSLKSGHVTMSLLSNNPPMAHPTQGKCQRPSEGSLNPYNF